MVEQAARFLTTLGVVIGSACIVLVVTVAVTGRRYVIGQIEGVGANLVYANYEVNPQQAVVKSNEITLADMDAVKAAMPNVVAVAGTRRHCLRSVVTGGIERSVALVGVTEGFQVIRNLLILQGPIPGSRGHAVAQQGLPDHRGTGGNGLSAITTRSGQSLRVGEISFTVIGVFRERVGTFGFPKFSNTGAGSVSADAILHRRRCHGYAVRAGRAPEDVPGVTRQVEELLRSRHPSGELHRAESGRDPGRGAKHRRRR